MKIAGITYDSFVDGPGLRVVVFAQGCDLGCANCHNPESWSTTTGTNYTVPQLIREIKKPRPGREFVRGLTLSGGEPFMQATELAEVAKAIKELGWDITTFTGHTYEKLIAATHDEGVQKLLLHTDYLIDGPYVDSKRTLELKFRGSSNQRIIDMNATRESGAVVLADM